MREVYKNIQQKIAPIRVHGKAQYDDREAHDDSSDLRLSFRFIDFREQSKACQYCNGSTRLDTMLENIHLSHSDAGNAFPLPKEVELRNERPDVVILNTGLWELMDVNGDMEWNEMREKLKSRTRALLQRWKEERTSEKLIWITTPSARPTDSLRKKYLTRDRLRWLGAMEVKLITEEVGV